MVPSKLRTAFFLSPYFLWLGIFVVLPLGFVLMTSFSHRGDLGQIEARFDGSSYTTLFDPLYLKIFLKTFLYAAANTLGVLLLAYPLTFFMTRQTPVWRAVIFTLILIPFWTSYLVRVLSFMEVLRLEPLGFEWIYSGPGVLGALIYNYLPCAVLPLYAVMEKIDISLFESARDLGASHWQVFRRVLLPLSLPGLINATLLVFIPSLGEYLIPDLVGGGQVFLLGSFLQNQFLTARNYPLGAAAICLILLFTLLLFIIFYRFLDEGEKVREGLNT